MSVCSRYRQRSNLQVRLRTRSRLSIRCRNRLGVRSVQQISQLIETSRMDTEQHPSFSVVVHYYYNTPFGKNNRLFEKNIAFFPGGLDHPGMVYERHRAGT